MKNIQILTDKVSIGLSLLCAIHCLAFPLLLVLLPSVAALQLDNEAFHLWMVLAVIPTSVYALTVGCKRHKHRYLLAVGLVGLAFLVLAVAFGESVLGEFWEKALTVLGAATLTYGHFKNYRYCSSDESCECAEQ